MNEAKRIIDYGGEIHPYQDEEGSFVGPPRIWLKGKKYPGLAMTRSFGDATAIPLGVNSIPGSTTFFLF